ncbi:MAG: hypothetical protein OXH34_01735 [Bacteroidetes bacterium]|nr:hypothetical protein [Bacteroidota bacterium]
MIIQLWNDVDAEVPDVSPTKLSNGEWGVKVPIDVEVFPSDIVSVESRSGKKWMAQLVKCDGEDKWGTKWSTELITLDDARQKLSDLHGLNNR